MEPTRTRDWVISQVALQEGSKRFGRKGQTHVVEWRDVDGLRRARGAARAPPTCSRRSRRCGPPTWPT